MRTKFFFISTYKSFLVADAGNICFNNLVFFLNPINRASNRFI